MPDLDKSLEYEWDVVALFIVVLMAVPASALAPAELCSVWYCFDFTPNTRHAHVHPMYPSMVLQHSLVCSQPFQPTIESSKQ